MSAMRELLAKHMSEIISEPDKTPKWLAEGISFLLAKTPETTNAKNYKPIYDSKVNQVYPRTEIHYERKCYKI